MEHLEILKVGRIYSKYAIKRDLTCLDYSLDGLKLVVFMQSPSQEEINSFNKKSIYKFKLIYIDGICYLLHKFGDNLWSDTPLRVHTNNIVSELLPNEGLSLQLLMFDSDNGKLHVIRLIGLPNNISNEILKYVDNAPKFSDYEFNKKVLEMQLKFTTEMLVNFADN